MLYLLESIFRIVHPSPSPRFVIHLYCIELSLLCPTYRSSQGPGTLAHGSLPLGGKLSLAISRSRYIVNDRDTACIVCGTLHQNPPSPQSSVLHVCSTHPSFSSSMYTIVVSRLRTGVSGVFNQTLRMIYAPDDQRHFAENRFQAGCIHTFNLP